MRHLYGTALATVMVVAMFFGGAWGYLELLKLPVPPGDPRALPAAGGSLLSNGSVLTALGVVAVTAVLAGVLVAVPRISPLAAGLPGLLLIAWTGLFLVSVHWATAIIPLRSDSFGMGWEALLFNGVLGGAGLVMVVPLFIPSRWRGRRPDREDPRDTRTRDMFEPAKTGAGRGAGASRGGSPRPAGRSRTAVTGPSRTTGTRTAATRTTGTRTAATRTAATRTTATRTTATRTTGAGPRTGLIGPATGPVRPGTGSFPAGGRPATGRPATGPIDYRTGPINTTSPIRTTGPIRINPPANR